MKSHNIINDYIFIFFLNVNVNIHSTLIRVFLLFHYVTLLTFIKSANLTKLKKN